MTYAVIIPAYNEAANLSRCIASLRRAAGDRIVPIIVIDNHSTDDTAAIGKADGATVLQPPSRQSISALRNLGAAHANVPILIFLDGDMEVPTNWFESLDKDFLDLAIDAIGYVETLPLEAPWFARAWSRRTASRRMAKRATDFLPGRNIAIRKLSFNAIDGFDPTLRTSEDKDLTLRINKAGGLVVTMPQNGIVHWGYERTLFELLRKEFWRQSSHLRLIRKHGPSMRLVRFPLMALGHLFSTALFPVGIAVGMPALTVPFLLSPVVSLSMALSGKLALDDFPTYLQLSALYYFRFLVSGVSILAEGLRAEWRR